MCTRLFLCLIDWFFCVLGLGIYSQACLIFCSGFVVCLIVFFGKLVIFACLNYFAGFIGVIGSISEDYLLRNSVFFSLCSSNIRILEHGNSFCGGSAFFLIFFAHFVRLFFYTYFCGFAQFKFAGSGVFLPCYVILPSA